MYKYTFQIFLNELREVVGNSFKLLPDGRQARRLRIIPLRFLERHNWLVQLIMAVQEIGQVLASLSAHTTGKFSGCAGDQISRSVTTGDRQYLLNLISSQRRD